MKSALAILACATALHLSMPVSAGLLDDIKKKADDAARSVRGAARDIDDVTKADERAAADAHRAVRDAEATLDSELDVAGRARAGIAGTDLGESAAAAEREAQAAQLEIERAASTDERAERELRDRMGSATAEVERRTDLEARAESAARQSQAGTAVAGAERDAAAIERELDAAGRVAQDPAEAARRSAERETDDAARALEGLGEATRELKSVFER